MMKELSVKFLILMLAMAWSFSNAQEVQVDVNFPDFCKTGEKCAVEITINKGAIEGFARLQQTLPGGFTAELIEDAGGDFIFDKQRVSFIWLNLPAESTVTVSYRIIVDASLSGSFDVGEGTFSYMKENRIQRHPLPPFKMGANVKVAPAVVAKETPVEKEQVPQVAVADDQKKETVIAKEVPEAVETEASKQQDSIVEEIPAGGIRIEPTVDKKEEQPAEEAVAVLPDTPSETPAKMPETIVTPPVTNAIYYRVQFTALKQYKDPESLRSQFNINEIVYHESSDGWNRYTFGQWRTRADAEAARKTFISRTGSNAIVIKYQDGKRIHEN